MINEREYLFASSFLKASDAEGTPADRLARFGAAADPEAPAFREALGKYFGGMLDASTTERLRHP